MYVHGLGDPQEEISRQMDIEEQMMEDAIRVEIKNWCCSECEGPLSLSDWHLDERDAGYCEFTVYLECDTNACDECLEESVSLFLY